MSAVQVQAALEQALAAISPALDTDLENEPYTPVVGRPYQRATVLFAEPDNSEYGPGYIEQGFMQVDLFFPQALGWGAAKARAELIRQAFKRGTTLLNGGVTTTINRTPSISAGPNETDRYAVTVRIRFIAPITS